MSTGKNRRPQRGGVPTVPFAPAEEHIAALQSQFPGMSAWHIMVRMAGCSSSALTDARRSGRAQQSTLDRILAVRPEHVAMCPPRHLSSAPVHARIRRWIKEPGVTIHTVARASGLSTEGLILMLNRGGSLVRFSTFKAIMSLTLDDVLAARSYVDRRPYVTMLRALQANGHPLNALGREEGLKAESLVAYPSDRMKAEVAQAIESLYRRIGDTPGPSLKARRCAQRLGFREPIHYDENMELPPSDGAQEMLDEEQARRSLRILAYSLDPDFSTTKIAETVGVGERSVGRIRVRAGVTSKMVEKGIYELVETVPGAERRIRAAIAGIDYSRRADSYDLIGDDSYADRLAVALGEALVDEDEAAA